MKKLKIDTLEKLETFISNDSLSIEARLEVFEHALKEYVFFYCRCERCGPKRSI